MKLSDEAKDWDNLMNTDIKADIEGMIADLESDNFASGVKIAQKHIDLLRGLDYHSSLLRKDEVLIFLKNELSEINREALL
jgi:hypothetical protein